jgi:hypothetical protein
MAQIFHRNTNIISKIIILVVLLVSVLTVWLLPEFNRSPYITQTGIPREQPIPFSHKQHVSELGIDCRYCHTDAEKTSFAGMPSTHTCMTCHSQILVNSPVLEPVRTSYKTGYSLEWLRVHDLPDFVYFNHSIHLHKGIGCVTCHGRVDQMPVIWKENSLDMEWCLDCHIQPELFMQPRESVFNSAWKTPKNQLKLGQKLVNEYNVNPSLDCNTCHQ